MTGIRKLDRTLWFSPLLLGAAILMAIAWPVNGNTQTPHEQEIPWQGWTIAPFEQAKRQNKMILVNVGMEGCAACARMEALTYTDPLVTDLIREHFIPIAVDSDARPDIGERYSDWAWPATIFMAPDATQVLAVRGNRLPRNFIPILQDLITKHESGRLVADPNSPYTAPPQPQETEMTLIRDSVRSQLDRSLNNEYGGWSSSGIGGEQSGPRLRNLFLRAHLYNDDYMLALALKGSEGYLRNIDPVWGGVYARSFPADMQKVPAKFARLRVIPEKRISAQSHAIEGIAIAYELTGDKRFLIAMRQMHEFMTNWFMAPNGTFYSNQRAEPLKLPDDMGPGDYWALDSDQKRRQFGIPAIDHAIYTDKNGEAIAAYVKAWEVFADVVYLQTAIRAANAILKSRSTEAGWVLQTTANRDTATDLRLRPLDEDPRPLLNAQALFGRGLLALYRTTGDGRWLEQAITIGSATQDDLEDKEIGGFFATSLDETSNIIAPRKLLHYEEPGRYPARKNPAMYICNPNMCSVPIEDPARVSEQAAAFRALENG